MIQGQLQDFLDEGTNPKSRGANLLLPPATELGQGYLFTRVCDSVHRGRGWYPSMHCRWYPSMPCSRSPGGGIPAWEVEGSGQGGWGVSRSTPKGEVEGSGQGGWGVSRSTPKGEVEGSGLGGSPDPDPGVSRSTPGGGGSGPHPGERVSRPTVKSLLRNPHDTRNSGGFRIFQHSGFSKRNWTESMGVNSTHLDPSLRT